ncbi:DUF1799 domain-containing protein [Rhodocyclus tenuis]|uniref:Uncharacterized protein n=1 Tax=Rhodocyclus tenuis TaxID=1066 RepID=A0A840GBY3_RHOTE|nr:DUF1799 domain-containing protein [Rhodocyclus tenuis]MBB4248390.1 hypothetical protein [Rhodocyclus tenuis]
MARSENVIDIWPENSGAAEVFLAMASQWQRVVSISGAWWSPPRHSDLQAAMHMLGVRRSDRSRLFAEIRAMFDACLEIMNAAH